MWTGFSPLVCKHEQEIKDTVCCLGVQNLRPHQIYGIKTVSEPRLRSCIRHIRNYYQQDLLDSIRDFSAGYDFSFFLLVDGLLSNSSRACLCCSVCFMHLVSMTKISNLVKRKYSSDLESSPSLIRCFCSSLYILFNFFLVDYRSFTCR